ncbi:TIGR04086 family membrane protein [Calderihabitans maritimus]|uniref:TIGR04086 family membrane protein n=1 Tax=Calderihabitans maritimus TaxID=1246530 RepID=A0A1Z5HVJ4_9FIRM|nr:TIGR04086 family membrane protein [Calderihabitans maritimus]GAW93310.1 hypothetical protein KKC1_24470 [Calderihabitans maritimus]
MGKRNYGAVLYGFAITFLILVVGILLSVIFVFLTSSRLVYVANYWKLVTFISLIAGGTVAGWQDARNGFLNGSRVGMVYAFLSILVTAIFIPQILSFRGILWRLVYVLILSGTAGIIGANFRIISRHKSKFSPVKSKYNN